MKREFLFVVIAAQAFSHVNGQNEVSCNQLVGYPCPDGTTILTAESPGTFVYTGNSVTPQEIEDNCCQSELRCADYKNCEDPYRIDPNKANNVGTPSELDNHVNCDCECAHGDIIILSSLSTGQHIVYEGQFPNNDPNDPREFLLDCKSFPVEYIPELKDAISQNPNLDGNCLQTT